MCTISTTEFKNNFEKYIELGQKEIIKVTKRGKVIFSIVPEKVSLVDEATSYLDMLPIGSSIGIDPDERR